MKYRNSLLEDKIRKRLAGSIIDPFTSEIDARVFQALSENKEEFTLGYLIEQIPYPDLDIYTILTNNLKVISIHVNLEDQKQKPVIYISTAKEYLKGLKGTENRLIIQMALEMIENDMKKLQK